MKNSFLLPLAIFALVLSSSCSKDEDTGPDPVLYDLTIQNSTTRNLDLYLKTDLDNTGFVNEGAVLASQTKKLEDLVVDVNYTLRVVLEGMDVDSVFAEQEFKNTDPDVFEINIEITE